MRTYKTQITVCLEEESGEAVVASAVMPVSIGDIVEDMPNTRASIVVRGVVGFSILGRVWCLDLIIAGSDEVEMQTRTRTKSKRIYTPHRMVIMPIDDAVLHKILITLTGEEILTRNKEKVEQRAYQYILSLFFVDEQQLRR